VEFRFGVWGAERACPARVVPFTLFSGDAIWTWDRAFASLLVFRGLWLGLPASWVRRSVPKRLLLFSLPQAAPLVLPRGVLYGTHPPSARGDLLDRSMPPFLGSDIALSLPLLWRYSLNQDGSQPQLGWLCLYYVHS
jgi:hypothetical protein